MKHALLAYLPGLVLALSSANLLAVCLKDGLSVDPSDGPVISWNLEFRRAKAVVIGTVLSEKNLYEAESPKWPSGTLYKLKREAILKGRLSEYVEVFSPNDSGRVPLAKGARYILFLSEQDGRFMDNGYGNYAKLGPCFIDVAALFHFAPCSG